MRATGDSADGARLRALIVVLWRAGLWISEALDLAETDLDRARWALVIRRGKGGRRREVGMLPSLPHGYLRDAGEEPASRGSRGDATGRGLRGRHPGPICTRSAQGGTPGGVPPVGEA
jgi:integrase